MPGTFIYSPDNKEFRTRFSKIYQPAAHDFFKAFEVVYSHYWLGQHLLDYEAVNLYNVLTFLAKSDQGFTINGLAYILKKSKLTIIKRLDDLENAELLYRFQLHDCQGRPDYFVLRTPLLADAEALTPSVRLRIQRAGEDTPKTFLDREAPRLRKQILQNDARKARGRNHTAGAEDLKKNWNKVLKEFSRDKKAALAFDNIVADLVHQLRADDLPLQEFERALKHQLKKNRIIITPNLIRVAHEQRAFYEYYLSVAPAKAKPKAEPTAQSDPSISDAISLYRSMIEAGDTFARITKQFRAAWTSENWEQITAATLKK